MPKETTKEKGKVSPFEEKGFSAGAPVFVVPPTSPTSQMEYGKSFLSCGPQSPPKGNTVERKDRGPTERERPSNKRKSILQKGATSGSELLNPTKDQKLETSSRKSSKGEGAEN